MNCPTCGFESKNLRGWKMHMSKSHGGYTDEQLQEVAAQVSSEQGAAASGFNSFNDAAAAIQSGAAAQPTEPGEKKERKVRKSKVQKEASEKLQADFDSMRGKFSEAIVAIFENVLTQSLEMKPFTPGEADAMKASVNFPFQALNIEFAIEPLNVNLTSFWYTLIIPISMFATMVLSRIMQSQPKGKANVKTETGGKPVQSEPATATGERDTGTGLQ